MDLSDAFAYAAPVLRRSDGMRMHYLPVPAEVAHAFREAGTRRVGDGLEVEPGVGQDGDAIEDRIYRSSRSAEEAAGARLGGHPGGPPRM